MADGQTQLWELVKLVRSKNAGPFTITIDIMFDNEENYARVKDSGVVNPEMMAALYGVPTDQIQFTEHDAAMSLKVSLPRRVASGGIGDTDVFGGQFHGPIVEMAIP